jgi:nucleotide-binding universal stress UspA family protein
MRQYERVLLYATSEEPVRPLHETSASIVPGNAVFYELCLSPAPAGTTITESLALFPRPLPGAGDKRWIFRRSNDPGSTIMEIVEDLGIDLVVLWNPVPRTFRKSPEMKAVDRIIAVGRVPVLLVPAGATETRARIRRVLLPFEYPDRSRGLLATAGTICRRSQAEGILLALSRILPGAGTLPPLRSSPDGQASSSLASVARQFTGAGLSVRAFETYDEPWSVVPRLARNHDVDLILLSHEVPWSSGRVMTPEFCRHVAREAGRPVLFQDTVALQTLFRKPQA